MKDLKNATKGAIVEGLQFMRYLGRNMAWLLKLKETGDKNGVALPEQEEARLATNLYIFY